MAAHDRPAWVPNELYPFEDGYLDINGSVVHYVDEGSGPTLLLLHGNPTWSFLYRKIINGLRDEYRCVALDYPGFGLSTAPAGYGYTPAEHADVVAGIVQQLDLTEVTMMVQDWGGPVRKPPNGGARGGRALHPGGRGVRDRYCDTRLRSAIAAITARRSHDRQSRR